jgi:putative Mn2+ efflux pump MntP
VLKIIAVVLITFGGWVLSFSFKADYQKIGPILAGAIMIALGFYILPNQDKDQPDIYYRK